MSDTVHLIDIGAVPAVPVSELQPGDRVMWDYGQTSEVISIAPVSAKTFELVTRDADGEWAQRKRGSTLIALACR